MRKNNVNVIFSGVHISVQILFFRGKKNATTYFNYLSFPKGTAKTGNVARKKQLVLTLKK